MGIERAIDALRPAIVQVLLRAPGATRPHPIGTGFVVTQSGHVATAKHVTAVAQDGGAGELFVGFAQLNSDNSRSNFTQIRCDVVEEDPDHDLALLAPEYNPLDGLGGTTIVDDEPVSSYQVGVATLSTARPADGASIAVSGYPLAEPTLITTAGIVASAWGHLGILRRQPGVPGWRSPVVTDRFGLLV